MTWPIWLGVAIALILVVLATADITFMMLATGALVGALAAAFGAPLAAQVILALVTSVAMLFVVRPIAIRHLKPPHELQTGVDALIDSQGVTLESITRDSGTVRLNGEVWSARPDDWNQIIAADVVVTVIRIDGVTAIVKEK